jgi:hypothetical protein
LEVLHEGNEGRNRNLLSWAGGVDQPEPEPAADRLDGRAKDQGAVCRRLRKRLGLVSRVAKMALARWATTHATGPCNQGRLEGFLELGFAFMSAVQAWEKFESQ